MGSLSFIITQEVLDLGVRVLTARISGIKNLDSSPEFEELKKIIVAEIKSLYGQRDYQDDPILQGFRDLHTKVGRSNRDYVASPEGLRSLLLKRGRFPHINLLVDIYNLVSLKTGLALGAHDVDRIQGNITLRLTKGSEIFIPLGKSETVPVFPGEYAYVDDGNNVICRLEVLQVEPTKVTTNSSDIFLIVQGNEQTSGEYIQNTTKEVCDLISRLCGGTVSFLNSL